MILAYVALVAPSLGQSLLESHAYRQTQTAYTALLFARDGIDLLRPPLPVLGLPGIVPLEFPLFQAGASLLMGAGLVPDVSVRLVGLASFVASATLVFALARRVLTDRFALVALAAFLFNPHALLYGRAALIEYLAVACGLTFVLFMTRWLDGNRALDWAVALAAGAGLLLVKVTTGPIYLLPVLLWHSPRGTSGYRRLSVWLALVIAGAVGLAWSQYADAVRSGSPATDFLAARNSFEWFFGTMGQRLDLGEWRIPLVAILQLTGFGVVGWAVLAWRFASPHRQRAFLVAILFVTVAAPLLLFNLYAEHDYYFAAIAPFVALAVGMGAEHLLRSRRTRMNRRLLVGLAGAWVATFIGSVGTWSLIYGEPREEDQVLQAAAFIREHSKPDDWVVIKGFGWNSTFLYYSRRQGFADPTGDNLLQRGDIDVEAIIENPIYGPFFTCDAQGQCRVRDER